MAIELTHTNAQGINFGTTCNIYGLAQKTISFKAYFSNVAACVPPRFQYISGLIDTALPYTDESWVLLQGHTNNGDLFFEERFSTTPGQWRTNAGAIAINTKYSIIWTYDNSDVANNPVLYINNVNTALNEDTTPVGSAKTGINSILFLGAPGAGQDAAAVKIEDFVVINRIVSTSERYMLAFSNDKNINLEGTVFRPNLIGATNLGNTLFDGAALGATNKILDEISRTTGVPNSSPIGQGDTVTNFGEGVI